MRRLLPFAGAAAAALLTTWSAPARADSGEAMFAIVMLGIFDLVSLPVDIGMAVTNTPVPLEYARIEFIAGTVQSGLGGLGVGVCAADRECREGPGLPLLVGFTAWTSIMAIHGGVSLFGPNRKRAPERMNWFSMTGAPGPRAGALAPEEGPGRRAGAPAPEKGPSLTLVPIVGDARTAPAGVGIRVAF